MFGRLPALVALAMIAWCAVRRGWSWRAAVLVTCAFVAGLSAGTALFPSIVGALFGGVAAWLVAQRVLGIRRAPFADLAIAFVIVLAVGRIGCLVNGCCFGMPTELPWSVEYGMGSAAWRLHHALGWIGGDATHSLPVHPYPLYESAALVLWLPVLLILRRRLRSEGAVLAATAAFDLVVRAFLDNLRAMVNVWWSLIDARYTFMLVAAAGALVLVAAVGERRARMSCPAEATAPGQPDEGRLWWVYAFVWVLGWCATVDQTPFLRLLLIIAMVAGAIALPWSVVARALWMRRVWARGVVLVVVFAPLAVHLNASAQWVENGGGLSSGQAWPGGGSLGWMYEVDHDRSMLVRIGAAGEDADGVEARRRRLGLVDKDWKWKEAEPESATSRTATGRLWMGGGLGAGSTQYRKDESGDGCSGDYSIYDRKGVNGWLQAEWEQPVGDNFVTWFGVRGGGLGETIKREEHKESQVELRSNRVRTGFGQGWFELEKPTLSFGLGVLVARESTVDEAGNDVESGARGRLGGRFRGGFSGIGIDVGYVDRASMLGFPGAHIGVSGAIYDTDGAPHPDDWVFRYFAGWQTFPGAQVDDPHLMPGLGIQANVSRRYVFGLDGIFGGEGAAGAAHFMMVVSP